MESRVFKKILTHVYLTYGLMCI